MMTVPLGGNLRLQDYLLGYGYTANPSENSLKNIPAFTNALVNDPTKYKEALRVLNGLVSASRNEQTLDFNLTPPNHSNTLPLLKLSSDCKLLDFDDRRFAFTDESARRYVCGGWLEEYVYETLLKLGKKIQDKARNLTIKSHVQGVKNEADVAFLAKNCLHLIECKTARLEHKNGSAALYKLKTLMVETGLKTKAMLVSWRGLDESTRTPHGKRARKYVIKVVQKDDLRNLKNLLEQWIAEK